MSCWMSLSRMQTTFTGLGTCLPISTARTMKSVSSRRPKPPPRGDCGPSSFGGRPVTLRGHGPREGAAPACRPRCRSRPGERGPCSHRFHRRVREKWHFINGIDASGQPAIALAGVPVLARGDARPLRGFCEVPHDIGGAAVHGRPSSHDHERRCAVFRGPRVIGDYRHGVAARTTCCTPFTASPWCRPRSRLCRRTPGKHDTVATFMPGTFTSMANSRGAVDLLRGSRRFTAVPISLKSFGSLSWTFRGATASRRYRRARRS